MGKGKPKSLPRTTYASTDPQFQTESASPHNFTPQADSETYDASIFRSIAEAPNTATVPIVSRRKKTIINDDDYKPNRKGKKESRTSNTYDTSQVPFNMSSDMDSQNYGVHRLNEDILPTFNNSTFTNNPNDNDGDAYLNEDEQLQRALALSLETASDQFQDDKQERRRRIRDIKKYLGKDDDLQPDYDYEYDEDLILNLDGDVIGYNDEEGNEIYFKHKEEDKKEDIKEETKEEIKIPTKANKEEYNEMLRDKIGNDIIKLLYDSNDIIIGYVDKDEGKIYVELDKDGHMVPSKHQSIKGFYKFYNDILHNIENENKNKMKKKKRNRIIIKNKNDNDEEDKIKKLYNLYQLKQHQRNVRLDPVGQYQPSKLDSTAYTEEERKKKYPYLSFQLSH